MFCGFGRSGVCSTTSLADTHHCCLSVCKVDYSYSVYLSEQAPVGPERYCLHNFPVTLWNLHGHWLRHCVSILRCLHRPIICVAVDIDLPDVNTRLLVVPPTQRSQMRGTGIPYSSDLCRLCSLRFLVDCIATIDTTPLSNAHATVAVAAS